MSEQPLRICHITTFYPPYSFGGDAIYAHALANELAARGHHIHVIHCRDSYRLLQGGEPTRTVENHPNVIVHGLASRAGLLSPLATQQTGYPLFKQREIKNILTRGFDVIHYHNISLVGGPGVLALGQGVKLYSTQEYWLVCPMNVLFRYDGVACTEKKCLRCTLAYRRPPQWWRYTRLLQHQLRHVDLFLVPSRFSEMQTKRAGLDLPTARLPNFHVPPEQTLSDNLPENASPYFLYVGRLETLKGVQTLIPVFRNYPRAQLLIAGEGSLLPKLRADAHGSDNIKFLGWQNKAQLQQLYRGAVAAIVPSLCFEGGPLVLYEAFYNGTPVIARDLGALPEFVQENAAGLLFDDDATLRTALDTLLDQPARRDVLGNNARQAYASAYTPEIHLERYLELIHTVREKKHRGT